MDQKIKDNRDVLFTLLISMGGEQPRVVDLDELSDVDKVFLLVSCCIEMAASAILAMSKDPEDRRLGLEALLDDIKAKYVDDDPKRRH